MNLDKQHPARYHDTIGPALQYAALKHAGQTRKGPSKQPYLSHVIAVANILAVAGVEDREVLKAAVLHDTIEDTKTKYEDLVDRFGATVADYVMECTDDKKLPADERKRLQIVHAPDLSPGAKLIKLADKLHNLQDMLAEPPVGWDRARKLAYVDWSEAVVNALGLRREGPAATLLRNFDLYTIKLRAALL